MARIRTIKPEFQLDEGVGHVSRDARLLLLELLPFADDAGRLRATIPVLVGALFPFDADAFERFPAWLAELEQAHFVRRYAVAGQSYLQIDGWLDELSPIGQHIEKPSKLRLPAPSDDDNAPTPPQAIAEDSQNTSHLLSDYSPATLRRVGPVPGPGPGPGPSTKDRGPGTKDQRPLASSDKKHRSPPTEPKTSQPAVFDLPLVDGTAYGLPQSLYDEYLRSYPGISVMAELGKMRAWFLSNLKRRRTRNGITHAINSWLARAQDSGHGQRFGTLISLENANGTQRTGQSAASQRIDATDHELTKALAARGIYSACESSGEDTTPVSESATGPGGGGISGGLRDFGPEILPPENRASNSGTAAQSKPTLFSSAERSRG